MTTEQHASTTRHTPSEPAPAAPAVMQGPTPPSLTREQRRRGGRAAGKLPRHVALIGLGVDDLPALRLKTSAERMAILEATLGAVVRGRTSGMVAQTIISLVKTANELARGDQEDQLRALEARVAELIGSRVVPAGRASSTSPFAFAKTVSPA